jgi:D-arabinose 1-dehydrogenase-like Zn-dependent alcohol dehydrogenase
MSQVNEAIQRVKQNKARYRIVLVNDMDALRHKEILKA